jgi:hypothetical protein
MDLGKAEKNKESEDDERFLSGEEKHLLKQSYTNKKLGMLVSSKQLKQELNLE